MERVAAYIRVSTQEQKLHGISLDAQTEKLQSYADAHELQIVGWYRDEGVSGRKLIKKRPELQRMIQDAQRGLFTRIIFVKLDRFFRSVAEYHEAMKMLEPVVWTATEEKFDMTTASGRAFINMKLTIAEMEADQTGERIKLVNEYLVKTGQPLLPTRCLPICYACERDDQNRRVMVKRNAAEFSDLIEQVFLFGSVRSALREINRKYGVKWEYQYIVKALKNPLICGRYRDNMSYCEPYISKADYDRLQEIIRIPARERSGRSYLFSGLLVCPSCGRVMDVHAIKNHNQTKDSLSHYVSYYCRLSNSNRDICPGSSQISELAVERAMLRILDERLGSLRVEFGDLEPAAIYDPSREIEALKSELDRLSYVFTKGRIPIDAYESRYEELSAQISALESSAVEIKKPQAIASLPADWLEIYDSLDAEHRRAFWRSIVKSIEPDFDSKPRGVKAVIWL